MTRAYWTLGLALALAGRGESGPRPGPTAPHGGVLLGLPDDKGFVEVVRRDSPGQPGTGRIVVDFLDPSKNAMNPPPTSATLKLRASKNPKPIDLKPAEAGALETPPLPVQGDLEGELAATVDGKPINLSIAIR